MGRVRDLTFSPRLAMVTLATAAVVMAVAGTAPAAPAAAPGSLPATSPSSDAGTARPAEAAARLTTAAAGNVTPADIEDVEHMCALLTACDKLPLPAGLVPRDFVGCTRALHGELASPAAVAFSLTLRDCGLRASSCGELRSCALRGARADVCAGRGKSGSVEMCDGDGRAVTCTSERVALVRDCPRGGEQCVVQEGRAVCALGSCEKDAAPACSPSGTRVLECKKGKLLSLVCGAFGLLCSPSSAGGRAALRGSHRGRLLSRARGAHRLRGARDDVRTFHARARRRRRDRGSDRRVRRDRSRGSCV